MKKKKFAMVMILAITVTGLGSCSPITQNETINVEVKESGQTTVKDQETYVEDQETYVEESSNIKSSTTWDTCEIYVPNVESLNIRANSEHKSDLVKTIHSNEKMMFYGEIGQGYGSDDKLHDWYKIYLFSGETGWVRSDLISKDTCVIYVPNVEALNVRANPEHNSNLVTTVYSNEQMMFHGEIGQGYGSDDKLHDWYKIYLSSGESGWVRSDLVYRVN